MNTPTTIPQPRIAAATQQAVEAANQVRRLSPEEETYLRAATTVRSMSAEIGRLIWLLEGYPAAREKVVRIGRDLDSLGTLLPLPKDIRAASQPRV